MYVWLLAGWLIFVVYGSLLPFDFAAVPWPRQRASLGALARHRHR